MLAKLRSGNAYDLIFPTADYVPRLISRSSCCGSPRASSTNRDNIYGFFDDPWYDPDSAHTVPYALYITGHRLPGRQVGEHDRLLGRPRERGGARADLHARRLPGGARAGNLVNGYDMNTSWSRTSSSRPRTAGGPEAAPARLHDGHITNMSSGNAWIQHLWNGDIINIRYRVDDPEHYQFQKTKEGFPVGSDLFSIPVNAEHPGTALLFIDFMLDPRTRRRTSAGTATRCRTRPRTRRSRSWPGRPEHRGHHRRPRGRPAVRQPRPRDDRELWTNTFLEVKARDTAVSEPLRAPAAGPPGGCGCCCSSRSRWASCSRCLARDDGRPRQRRLRLAPGELLATSSTRCSRRCCCARSPTRSPPWPLPADRLPDRLLHRPLRRPLEDAADRGRGAAVPGQLPGPHLRLGGDPLRRGARERVPQGLGLAENGSASSTPRGR